MLNILIHQTGSIIALLHFTTDVPGVNVLNLYEYFFVIIRFSTFFSWKEDTTPKSTHITIKTPTALLGYIPSIWSQFCM